MNTPSPLPAPREMLSITYASTRADHWRCNLYTLFRNKWNLLLLGGCALLLSFNSPFPALASNAFMNFVLIFAASAAGLVLINLVVLSILIPIRTRSGQVRQCTTALMPEGVRDFSPEKTRMLHWNKITQIREHRGDVYVFSGIVGIYIPRSGFKNPEEARFFTRLAAELWRTKGASWSQISTENWRAGETPPVSAVLLRANP